MSSLASTSIGNAVGVDAADGRLPRRPLGYLMRRKLPLATGIVALFITNGLAQAIPWVVKHAIEGIEKSARNTDSRDLAYTCGLIGVLACLQALIRVISRVTIFNAGREAEYGLRREIFAHLCRLDQSFYRRFRTGDLMSRLTNDLAAVRVLYGPGILHSANTTFAYVIALPLMITIDGWLTFWSLLPYPLLLLGARAFARGIYARSAAQQRALAAMTEVAQEDLAGIRELKSYRIEHLRGALFVKRSSRYLEQAIALAGWRTGMMPLVGIGAGVSLVILLWLGGQKVGAGRLSLGDLVALNMYVTLLAWPAMALGWIISLWQSGESAWNRLRELVDSRPLIQDSPQAGAPSKAVSSKSDRRETSQPGFQVDIRQLTAFWGEKKALEDVSLVIPGGTICAIVGRVGSGKSTLVECITRLVPVPPGSVFLGGLDVTTRSLSDIRRHISYAPQDAFLFSATVRQNIALGIGSKRVFDQDKEIAMAVNVAGLDPDIAAFPAGLDTIVGERGITLSGGQRQRVALARALVAKRPVLVLDDSLSAVDAETEKVIIERIRKLLRGTTTILTSHRLSALQHADQVIVLDEGRVVEQGAHQDLINRSGPYASLYRAQIRT